MLVVGAGPTGLTLAAQLHAFGASVRLIDRELHGAQESRALAIQPRTLEVLQNLDLSSELVARGNPAVRLRLEVGSRVLHAPLFDIGLEDTAFPFMLFLSQAETEKTLTEHLEGQGASVEQGVEFLGMRVEGDEVLCTLRRRDGSRHQVRSRYLVGCDGAHSRVRDQARIPFLGGGYPQTFLLADLAAGGLEPGSVNTFLTEQGPLFFFPLERPAPWRLIAMRPVDAGTDGNAGEPTASEPVSLGELQGLCDTATAGRVRLENPVWATAFRLHHRQAARYGAGPVFLAGDAAHIHSPAGAQGMNTGIQDAINLGWKMALVSRGCAPETLLDSYDAERRPVGAFVLRFTDRAFTIAASTHPVVRAIRGYVAPRLLPLALRFGPGRAAAFRTISQLRISYRRSSAGTATVGRPRRGPRAGDRLPDVKIVENGRVRWLHEALTGASFNLLLCGPVEAWNLDAVGKLVERHEPLLRVFRLDRRPGRAILFDRDGTALRRLRVRGTTALLVRPDGHIGWRTDSRDLAETARWLARWLPE